MVYQVPEAFAEDRSRRSERRVDLPITVRVWLTPGAQRVDFETTVENRRLRPPVAGALPGSLCRGAGGGLRATGMWWNGRQLLLRVGQTERSSPFRPTRSGAGSPFPTVRGG